MLEIANFQFAQKSHRNRSLGEGSGFELDIEWKDGKLVEAYKKNGVKVVAMDAAQHAAWLDIAKQSSYKIFSEKVPGGKELIEKALAVD